MQPGQLPEDILKADVAAWPEQLEIARRTNSS
jgi:hypothetical protein